MKKIAFISLMPNFLRHLEESLPKLNYEIKFFQPTSDNSRNMWELSKLCSWADVVFCEFCQHPMEIVTNYCDKPIVARLWRIETFNLDIMHKINWSNVDVLLTPSENIKDRFLKIRRKKPLPKSIEMFDGPFVDLSKFTPIGRRFPDSKVKLVIAGNVIPRKRAFDACQLLYELPNNYSLSIVGAHRDFEYITHIKDFCKSAKITDKVTLLGDIPHESMPKVFKNHDIILALSTEETAHYAAGEAMACGCYPVMSYWPGIEKLYPSGTYHLGMSKLFSELWNYNEYSDEQKLKLSKASWDWAYRKFDSDREIDQIVEIIERF